MKKKKSKEAEALSFTFSNEENQIEMLKMQELSGYESVTRVANAPEYIKGVATLRRDYRAHDRYAHMLQSQHSCLRPVHGRHHFEYLQAGHGRGGRRRIGWPNTPRRSNQASAAQMNSAINTDYRTGLGKG